MRSRSRAEAGAQLTSRAIKGRGESVSLLISTCDSSIPISPTRTARKAAVPPFVSGPFDEFEVYETPAACVVENFMTRENAISLSRANDSIYLQ